MTPQEKLSELYELKIKIESKEFQHYIMKPLYEELDSLGKAYEQNSLRELATLKGRKQGLSFIIKLLKEIDAQVKNLKYEIGN